MTIAVIKLNEAADGEGGAGDQELTDEELAALRRLAEELEARK